MESTVNKPVYWVSMREEAGQQFKELFRSESKESCELLQEAVIRALVYFGVTKYDVSVIHVDNKSKESSAAA